MLSELHETEQHEIGEPGNSQLASPGVHSGILRLSTEPLNYWPINWRKALVLPQPRFPDPVFKTGAASFYLPAIRDAGMRICTAVLASLACSAH